MLRFKDWFLNEISTSTGCIAVFARPCLPMVTRQFAPNIINEIDPEDNEKKRKKKSSHREKA